MNTYKITYIKSDCPHPRLESHPEFQRIVYYEGKTPCQAVRAMIQEIGYVGTHEEHNASPVVWCVEMA